MRTKFRIHLSTHRLYTLNIRKTFFSGKFYEMFHMDADIGVQVCGFCYMKGHVAHAGFPEISYGIMADKLVRGGYKVARVEQTETPEQLTVRKKTCARGTAPKVVNREVCSILTLGTRTFCYLDNEEAGILDEGTGGSSAPVGPLLAIREIGLDGTTVAEVNDDDEENIQPVCEYGITLVDATRGCFTIGQFADDVLRSRLVTLMTAFSPSEVRLLLHDPTRMRLSPNYLPETFRFFWKVARMARHRLFYH